MSRKSDKNKIKTLENKNKAYNKIYKIVDDWAYGKLEAKEALNKIAGIVYH